MHHTTHRRCLLPALLGHGPACSMPAAQRRTSCQTQHRMLHTTYAEAYPPPPVPGHRIAYEGLPFLLPHITKQRLELPLHLFERLIIERSVPIPYIAPNGYVQPPKPEPAAGAAAAADGEEDEAGADGEAAAGGPAKEKQAPMDDAVVVQQLPHIKLGGAVAVLAKQDALRLGFAVDDEAAGALVVNAPLSLSVWRAKASMNVLVGKAECGQLMDKIASARARLAKQAGEGQAQQVAEAQQQ